MDGRSLIVFIIHAWDDNKQERKNWENVSFVASESTYPSKFKDA